MYQNEKKLNDYIVSKLPQKVRFNEGLKFVYTHKIIEYKFDVNLGKHFLKIAYPKQKNIIKNEDIRRRYDEGAKTELEYIKEDFFRELITSNRKLTEEEQKSNSFIRWGYSSNLERLRSVTVKKTGEVINLESAYERSREDKNITFICDICGKEFKICKSKLGKYFMRIKYGSGKCCRDNYRVTLTRVTGNKNVKKDNLDIIKKNVDKDRIFKIDGLDMILDGYNFICSETKEKTKYILRTRFWMANNIELAYHSVNVFDYKIIHIKNIKYDFEILETMENINDCLGNTRIVLEKQKIYIENNKEIDPILVDVHKRTGEVLKVIEKKI